MNDEASSSSNEADAIEPKKRGRPRKVVDEKAKKAIGELVKGWKGRAKTPAKKRAPRRAVAEPQVSEEHSARGSAEAVLSMLEHAGLVTAEQIEAARVLTA